MSENKQSVITKTIGFTFSDGETQPVNASDLLRLRAACRAEMLREVANVLQVFSDDISAAVARNYYKGVNKNLQIARRDEQLSIVRTLEAHALREDAEVENG